MPKPKLRLDFECLDSLFGVRPEDRVINLKHDSNGDPPTSLNTQQLYNWTREMEAHPDFIQNPSPLKGCGFHGLQPVISVDNGYHIEIPDVPDFLVIGTILSEVAGDSPYILVNQSTILRFSEKARPFDKIFICHSSSDNAEATRLNHILSSAYETFFDQRDLRPGQIIKRGLFGIIPNNLRDADYLLLLMSPRSLSSKWVEWEWRWWLSNKPEGSLITVMLHDVELPSQLEHIKYIKYEGDIGLVAREIAHATGLDLTL